MTRLSLLATSAERTLLVLTAALVLAVHLGGVLAPTWLVRAVPLGEDVQQILPAAQLVLLAAWAILGPGPLWLRLPAAPVLLLLWAVGWTSIAPQAVDSVGNWLPWSGVASVTGALVMRCCGLRMTVEQPDIARATRHPQFSIKALIILTTLIAVGLGILEWLRPSLRSEPELSSYLEQLLLARINSDSFAGIFSATSIRQWVLAAALAVTSLSALWCVLRPGPLWLRSIVAAVLAPLLGFYLANLTGGGWEMGANLAVSLTLLACVVGLSALPLRLCHSRLIQPRGTGFRAVLSKTSQDKLKTCPMKLFPETVA